MNNKFLDKISDVFLKILLEGVKAFILLCNTIIGSVVIGLVWGFGIYLLTLPLNLITNIPYVPTIGDCIAVVSIVTFLKNLPGIEYVKLNKL